MTPTPHTAESLADALERRTPIFEGVPTVLQAVALIRSMAQEIERLRDIARCYEELRSATDNGSESMTHDHAVAHVKALSASSNAWCDAEKKL